MADENKTRAEGTHGEFVEFPSISRLFRDCTISEKLDGTNGQILIEDVPSIAEANCESWDQVKFGDQYILQCDDRFTLRAGSRNRWLTLEEDNFGFAAWAKAHFDELVQLGPGRHHGEWWGSGIQRRYGLTEKRFSLFNTTRWSEERPACCHVVPVLFKGLFDTYAVQRCLAKLETQGSAASPGFMDPEGVVVFHEAGKHLYKVTIGNDGHKTARAG